MLLQRERLPPLLQPWLRCDVKAESSNAALPNGAEESLFTFTHTL